MRSRGTKTQAERYLVLMRRRAKERGAVAALAKKKKKKKKKTAQSWGGKKGRTLPRHGLEDEVKPAPVPEIQLSPPTHLVRDAKRRRDREKRGITSSGGSRPGN